MAGTLWCPSCGDEYVAGSIICSDCRVALVTHEPDRPTKGARGETRFGGASAFDRDDRDARDDEDMGFDEDLVELGIWPRLQAVILRRRLEAAGVSVLIDWSSPQEAAEGAILVPESQAEFADAVVRELPVEDEPSLHASPGELVDRLEAALVEASGMLDELRTRLEQPGEPG